MSAKPISTTGTVHDIAITVDENDRVVPVDDSRMSMAESWAQDILNRPEQRNIVGNNLKASGDQHSIAGIFQFEDNVSLREAWEDVGGNRVGVSICKAYSGLEGDNMVEVEKSRWVYPLLDGSEFNPSQPLSIVSSNRYEAVNPNDVVDVISDHFVDDQGKPYPVNVLAFSGDLNSCIVQFERFPIEVAGGDYIKRYFTVHIPIMGSVKTAAIDMRWQCMNMLPAFMSESEISIRHLTGANENAINNFSSWRERLELAQRLQEYVYQALSEIPVQDGDVDRALIATYPYLHLPAGKSQHMKAEEVLELTSGMSASPEDYDPSRGMIPYQNRQVARERSMAMRGYKEAREEVGDNLWALAQINFTATHYHSRETETKTLDMYISGKRRNMARKALTNVLAMASERSVEIPDIIKKHVLRARTNWQRISQVDEVNTKMSLKDTTW